MGGRVPDVLLLLVCVSLSVVGTLTLKAGFMSLAPADSGQLVAQAMQLATNPGVLAGVAISIVSYSLWMYAFSRLEISFAYLFTTLSVVLVLALSGVVLGEAVPASRWIGLALVVTGLIIATRN
jgi:drug/metabolite transporter (DMT)-like permease